MTVAMPGACLTRREPILSDILVLKILATGTPHISICLSNVFLMFSQTRTGTKTCAVYDIAQSQLVRVEEFVRSPAPNSSFSFPCSHRSETAHSHVTPQSDPCQQLPVFSRPTSFVVKTPRTKCLASIRKSLILL